MNLSRRFSLHVFEPSGSEPETPPCPLAFAGQGAFGVMSKAKSIWDKGFAADPAAEVMAVVEIANRASYVGFYDRSGRRVGHREIRGMGNLEAAREIARQHNPVAYAAMYP